jgi:hypothetical protein
LSDGNVGYEMAINVQETVLDDGAGIMATCLRCSAADKYAKEIYEGLNEAILEDK